MSYALITLFAIIYLSFSGAVIMPYMACYDSLVCLILQPYTSLLDRQISFEEIFEKFVLIFLIIRGGVAKYFPTLNCSPDSSSPPTIMCEVLRAIVKGVKLFLVNYGCK